MRTILVTGGSTGIGLAAAQALAARGDRLILVARGQTELAAAVAALPGEGHTWHSLDVSDEQAWEKLETRDVAGVVCAAGLIEPIGPLGTYSVRDFLQVFQVNVVGTLLAIEKCLPGLRSAGGSVVTFAGGGATAPLPRFDAYATSKAAVVRLSENLAAEIAPVRVNVVAPGFVATRLHEKTLAAGPDAAGRDFYERTRREVEQGGFPAAAAAELVVYLLSGVPFSGKLISAQWDPWRDSAFRARLEADADFATIRRIDGMFFDRVAKGDA